MTPIRVRDYEHFKTFFKDSEQGNGREFFILLNGGLRSSKHIWQESEDKWWILNEIDDSEQHLTKEELFDKSITNIGYATEKGGFFYYNYDDEYTE